MRSIAPRTSGGGGPANSNRAARPQPTEAQAQGQRSNIYVCFSVLTMLPCLRARRARDKVCTTHQEAA